MLNPLFCIMLMSESQSDQAFLHQLYKATCNKPSSVAIQNAINELLNDVDAVSISEPVEALTNFIRDYAMKSLTPLDTFVDNTTERYAGTFTDIILQKTPLAFLNSQRTNLNHQSIAGLYNSISVSRSVS